MALFKPVLGDSSRISLETTPFHEGWVYFTTDGFLYFDVNVGTEENPDNQRIKLKADADVAKKLVELNNALNISLWIGTKAEYDAIVEKDAECLYITTDDNEEPTVELVSNKVTVLNDSATNEQYPSAKAVWNILSNLNQYEKIENKVTVLDENSTDEQYPTAKAVYEGAFSVANKVAEEAEKLENKVTSISSSNTDAQYPSAKATYSAIHTLAEKIANKVTVIDDSASNTTYPSSLAVKNVITEKVDAVIPELEQKIEEGTANVVRTTEDATMQAKLIAQNNSDHTVAQVRNIVIMEHDPSVEDLSDGEICVVI